MSEGYWTGLQGDYDRAITKGVIAGTSKKVMPCVDVTTLVTLEPPSLGRVFKPVTVGRISTGRPDVQGDAALPVAKVDAGVVGHRDYADKEDDKGRGEN